MTQNHPYGFRKLWTRMALVALLLLPVWQVGLAAYKIHLKDGRTIEAKSKPVSMEGRLHYSALDGSFQTLPIDVVDFEQTKNLNPSGPRKQPITRILTNDDFPQTSYRHSESGDRLSNGKPDQPVTGKPSLKRNFPSREEKRGETYWRTRAKQIGGQMAAVDAEIRKLDEKRDSGETDGIPIGFATTSQYLLVNLEDQKKKLEKNKGDLENQMRALEEEARQAGAMPGWLR
jgi:hypothetical protein